MGRKLPQLSEVKWSPNEFSELIDLASGIHNLFHDLCLYRNYNTDQPRRLAAIRRTIPAPYSWPAAQGLARIADIFRPYGIASGISCYFASPEDFGLQTSDPLEEDVIAWWDVITNEM